MRLRLAVLSLAAVCAGAAPPSSAAADDYDGAQITSARPLGTNGVDLTISTPAFSAPTHVQVFLPAGYGSQPKRRWPVTYYLHGAQGDDTRFNAWYGDLIHTFPSIVVSPSGGAFGFYSDWYNAGRGGPPMYETYDIDQLIPLIDANFRTIARRQDRALIGESMGGYGVMTYAARHPDLFGVAASLSGFLDSNWPPAVAVMTAAPLLQGGQLDAIYGSRLTDEVRWRGHNPTDLAGNLRNVALQVRTANGTLHPPEEPANAGDDFDCVVESAIHQTSVDFEQRLEALGIPHVWKDYGPGCHTIWNFRREFTDALPGIEQAFVHPQPDPTTVDYESIEPRFSVWGWSVTTDPKRALEFIQMNNASRRGVTFVGSGSTAVTTPPFFRGLRAVDVDVSGAAEHVLTPGGDGRLRFTVDLGPAHRDQQYTIAASLAGAGRPGYFTTRSVVFAPHARVLIVAARVRRRGGARVCVRSLGGAVRHARLTLRSTPAAHGPGRVVGRRTLTVTTTGRCVRLARRRLLGPGRYTARVRGRDGYGHPVAATRRVDVTTVGGMFRIPKH